MLRKESTRLWEQAEEDLDTADKLLQVKKYYASVFFSEQAAEKAPLPTQCQRNCMMPPQLRCISSYPER